MKTVAIVSLKGGVGKTTTTANLGVALARRRRSEVLVMDLDPRNQLGIHLGLSSDAAGLAQASLRGLSWSRVQQSGLDCVSCLPFGAGDEKQGRDFDALLSRQPSLLGDGLADLGSQANGVVVLDTAPWPSPLLDRVLALADLVIVVLLADAASFATLPTLQSLLRRQRDIRTGGARAHLLLNCVDGGRLGRDVRAVISVQPELPMLPFVIHRDTAVPGGAGATAAGGRRLAVEPGSRRLLAGGGVGRRRAGGRDDRASARGEPQRGDHGRRRGVGTGGEWMSWLGFSLRALAVTVAVALLLLVVVTPLDVGPQLAFGGAAFALALVIRGRGSARAAPLLTLLSLVASSRYIWWRVSSTIDFDSTTDWILGLLLLGAELYAYVVLVLGAFQTLCVLRAQARAAARRSLALADGRRLHPDLQRAARGGAPDGARGACASTGRATSCASTCSTTAAAASSASFAASVKANYIVRAEHTHAKAGNLNHALGVTDGELIAIFDCDHIAARSFLQLTIGWFMRDPKLGMLQTPHHFYNPDPIERNLGQFRRVPNEGELFYGYLQGGNDFWNATFFCGSCAVIRRSALTAVGGIATDSLTEDALTSLKLQRLGYRTAYLNVRQAAGLATDTLAAHIGQRVRWAQGMTQILRLENPLVGRGLSVGQRLCYLNASFHFLYGLPRLIFLVGPLAYLLLGAHICTAAPQVLIVYLLPHLLHSMLVDAQSRRRFRYAFWNSIYETVLAIYILVPTLMALLRPRAGVFKVTDKGQIAAGGFDRRIARPYLVLLLFDVAGATLALMRLFLWDYYDSGTVLLNLTWVLVSIFSLGAVLAVACEARQLRRTHRLPLQLPASLRTASGHVHRTQTRDLSLGGASVHWSEPLPEGAAVELGLFIGSRGVLAARALRRLRRRPTAPRLRPARRTPGVGPRARPVRAPRRLDRLGERPSRRPAAVVAAHAARTERTRHARRPGGRATDHGRSGAGDDRHVDLLPPVAYGLAGAAHPRTSRGTRPAPHRATALCSRRAVMTLGRAVAWAALLGWVAASGEARAGNASLATERAVTVPLGELGLDAYTRRKWRSSRLTLRQRTRLDRVVTAARLRLGFAPAPLHGLRGLTILVNGVRVAEIPAAELRAEDGPREIVIDPRLFTADNDLTLVLESASSCVPAGSWALIAPASTLEVRQVELPGQPDLRWLPLPFVDPRLDATAEIPLVFAVAPSPAALRAAFLLAGAFALAAPPARLSFPVRVGALPPGNAVVVGTRSELARLGVGSAPALGLVERPGGHGQLLVISGSDQELPEVALRLAHALASRAAAATELVAGRPVSFAALASPDELALRGRRDGQIRVPFALPPATVFWPDAGLPVRLAWEESMARDAPRSRLVLTLNGHYVTTIQRASSVHAPGAHEARFRLPQAFLQRNNELTLSREAEPTESCPAAHDDELLRVLGQSTLDLRGATEFAVLPDLGQLVASGFPLTRARDLGATTIVVPRAPTPRTLAALLALAAQLARSSGVVATGAGFATAEELLPGLDRDLILVGTAREQPLLARWPELLPTAVAPRTGLVAATASPLHRGRTALVLTANDESALPDVNALFATPALGGERRNVALFADGTVTTEETGASWASGRLSPLQRGMWFLSHRAYLLLLFLLGGSWCLTRAALGATARRARQRLTLLLLLLAAAMPRVVHAEETPASVLEARARFWEDSGRSDKAIEVWEQLLRLFPKSSEAQRGVARCRAARTPAVGETREPALAGARALATAGKYDDAVAAYQRIFGATPPERYALEYYETLAGTGAGRSQAQAHLAELAAQHGNAPEYALAHARALAYDERTRRAGIGRLAELSASPAVAAKAQKVWRRALFWLDARAANRPLFDRYLARHSDDRELMQRRDQLASAGTRAAALRLGYARLNGGALDDAAAAFARVQAAAPHDPRALVGMSWVRLKQARFAEARALAEEAKRLSPATASLWQKPLQAARFWMALDDAAEAEKQKDWAAAAAALQRAQAAAPREVAEVALRRGRLLLAQGRAADAVALLRPLLPARLEALPTLVEALLDEGQTAEADRLQQDALAAPDSDEPRRRAVRLQIARARARAAAARGDDAAALRQLRDALDLDPADRDTRLELLYRELDADAASAAVAIGEALRQEHRDDPEIVEALALAEEKNGDAGAALAMLTSVAAERLTLKGRALRARLSLQAQVAEALDRGRGASRVERRLAELERETDANPDLSTVIAAAWWKAGKRERALATVRKALASAPSRSARLRCAGILLDAGAGQASELSRLLDDLGAESHLSIRERRQIEAIRQARLIRAVDHDRRGGDYRHAFLRLESALEAAPDDPKVLAALARLQASAGHPEKALALYAPLVERDPTDLALTEGAAFAAVAAGEMVRARKLAAAALEQHPGEPRAYLFAARIALARGDDPLGHHLLQLGLERSHQQPHEAAVSDGDVELAASRALIADARAQLVGDAETAEEEEEPPPPEEVLQQELTRLEIRYAPTAGAGIAFRFRSGEPGLSRLFEVDLPLSLQLSPGQRWGRFTAEGVPTYLDAQTLDLSDAATASAFGTDSVNTPTTLPLRLSSSVWGFAVALRYQWRELLAELGSTPIGFRVVDVIGQVGWQARIRRWTIGLRGLRNAVTDSVLSYSAGLRDPRTRIVWGGVRREGGEIDLDFDPGAVRAAPVRLVRRIHRQARRHQPRRRLRPVGAVATLSSPATDRGARARRIRDQLRQEPALLHARAGRLLQPAVLPHGRSAADSGTCAPTAGPSSAGGEAGVNYYNEDPSPLYPADGDLQAVRATQPDPGTRCTAVLSRPRAGRARTASSISASSTISAATSSSTAPSTVQFSAAYSQILLGIAVHKAFP